MIVYFLSVNLWLASATEQSIFWQNITARIQHKVAKSDHKMSLLPLMNDIVFIILATIKLLCFTIIIIPRYYTLILKKIAQSWVVNSSLLLHKITNYFRKYVEKLYNWYDVYNMKCQNIIKNFLLFSYILCDRFIITIIIFIHILI